MDGYLQLLLIIVATIIISFILFEAWFRRRQMKQVLAAEQGANHAALADAFDETTVQMETQRLQAQDSAARSNQAYANKTYSQPVARTTAPKAPVQLNDLLVISVVAAPGMQFGSYDMLQAISAAGLQFGEMNIFHYKIGDETLFSLSSASEPGDFNLDRIGDFFCEGLTLFTNLREVSHPESVFELMLNTAEQLEEDLNGELRMGTRKPWTEEAYQACLAKVEQFQLMKS
jgi:FtsZ-interacting cell division protein ZipA